jgi:hypothetical protein
MPLSEAPERELIHLRDIALRGYRRADGLFDIEAQLTDTKTYGFDNEDRGRIEAGEALHGMWMRMTVDDGLTIIACEAATDDSPYAICPQAAPNFSRLAGLKIGRGFLREANARVGGPVGCTHLRELLQQMATVAFQTVLPLRRHRAEENRAEAKGESQDARVAASWGGPTALLNTCLAYGSDSPVVKRRWPELYTGSGESTEPASS